MAINQKFTQKSKPGVPPAESQGDGFSNTNIHYCILIPNHPDQSIPRHTYTIHQIPLQLFFRTYNITMQAQLHPSAEYRPIPKPFRQRTNEIQFRYPCIAHLLPLFGPPFPVLVTPIAFLILAKSAVPKSSLPPKALVALSLSHIPASP